MADGVGVAVEDFVIPTDCDTKGVLGGEPTPDFVTELDGDVEGAGDPLTLGETVLAEEGVIEAVEDSVGGGVTEGVTVKLGVIELEAVEAAVAVGVA